MLDWTKLYARYINLNHRMDRRAHMEQELERVGLHAVRLQGMLPGEYQGEERKVTKMRTRTPGAIGCHYSQVKVMEEALKAGRHCVVLEDDLVFCSDIVERLSLIEKFLNSHPWDVFWLGGTYHKEPIWHAPGHPQLEECNCRQGKDWEPTDDPKFVRTYGCWSTHAYIVNVEALPMVLTMLEQNVHLSIGIDWLFILLQPRITTYAFVPGCVKQFDNFSDIGKGITKWSGFAQLGPHWFQDRMEDYKY